jgi:hypothetical protein
MLFHTTYDDHGDDDCVIETSPGLKGGLLIFSVDRGLANQRQRRGLVALLGCRGGRPSLQLPHGT